MPRDEEPLVSDHVYRMSEVVGSSRTSMDDAIRSAVRKAAETVRHLEWFETREIRGHVVDGEVVYFQVAVKLGFRVEDEEPAE
jgi:flavin-binding protein dodecin